MMEKISWKSMYLKIVLFSLISSKTLSKNSSASETLASERVGFTNEKYHRLPNENHLPHLELDDTTAFFISKESVGLESNVSIEKVAWSIFSDSVIFYVLSLYVMLSDIKPVVEDEIIMGYTPAASFIIASFIYCTFSLLCAWAYIISAPKFVVLFFVSNVFTYFLICLIFPVSLLHVLVYFVPIHVNFLFLLFTGWVTILSCKVVFETVKSLGILQVSNGEIVGNSFYIFYVTVAISCAFSMLTGLCSKFCIVDTSGNSLESMYFKMMVQYMFLVIIYLDLVMYSVVLVEVIFTFTNQIQDSGVRHRRHYLVYIIFHLFALVSWLYGILVVVTVPDYTDFWEFFRVVMAAPINFLKYVIITALFERSGNCTSIKVVLLSLFLSFSLAYRIVF